MWPCFSIIVDGSHNNVNFISLFLTQAKCGDVPENLTIQKIMLTYMYWYMVSNTVNNTNAQLHWMELCTNINDIKKTTRCAMAKVLNIHSFSKLPFRVLYGVQSVVNGHIIRGSHYKLRQLTQTYNWCSHIMSKMIYILINAYHAWCQYIYIYISVFAS